MTSSAGVRRQLTSWRTSRSCHTHTHAT